MNDQEFYRELQVFAEQLSKQAANMLIAEEKSFTITEKKDIVDVATSADIAVEKFIKSEVKKRYPDHGFSGEEFGDENIHAPYVWVIDPLDCTKDYVRGIGEYNNLIAVEHDSHLVAGVVRRIGHNQTYGCSRGNGAFCDGTPIHVSNIRSLDVSFVGSNFVNTARQTPAQIDMFFQLYKQLTVRSYRLRLFWDDSRLMSFVAQGSIDAAICIPNGCKWLDIAPALLLVEEAGGKVTNWHGEPVTHEDVQKGILVSNGLLHDQLLTIIQKEIYGKS